MSEFRFEMRVLEPSDQAFLWEMLYIALWDPPAAPPRPRAILDHPRIACLAQDWGEGQSDLGFAAILPDGTPIGAVWSRLLQPDEGGSYVNAETPQIGIAVLPEYHNRGVGTALLRHYLHNVSQRYKAVTLSVHPENHARFVYEKCGFVRYGTGAGNYWQMICQFADK